MWYDIHVKYLPQAQMSYITFYSALSNICHIYTCQFGKHPNNVSITTDIRDVCIEY